ncbi:MAG TPA: UDP-forming cellulose synthase catalytic subunit [Acidobacteriaceae bacterium]|jgi:cellulose synthase (UDP-forming)|nr:UDP-forming cellulose synthase catalytic subunit [Acidobacteriaceae bacterium]
MTRSPLWREFESGESLLARFLRFVVLAGGLLLLIAWAAVPLPWQQQALVSGLLVLLAMWLHRASGSYLTTLTLVLLSCFATLRYAIWRVHTVERYFRFRDASWHRLDAFFVLVVLAAEMYAFVALFLGYMQTLWPLRRTPVPLPDDPAQWPEVDLLIPTYNEPLRVVKYTALAALNIDWPDGKLNVYLLDDGRREEFREFAEQAGIGYMTRPDNVDFKAGNINRALERLNSPFVAIFDADHVPTRSFLQLTMGWFERDARLALIQTPQHFYSPDPFERNLDQFRNVPSENELFYGVVQDGNDLWNATSFCGSCAVLRREALDEIGGLATETVTEDAHTSLRLQKKGWGTAYINIPQAAGLATERLSGHIRQRVRWARGMIQILRIENPLFARGLKFTQRLCYFNATAHFLFALPRLVFLTAPLVYLIFGRVNLPGFWAAILAYAAAHLILLHLTHSRIQGRHRHSFWNEIYETVLAPYILLPTIGALMWSRKGRFNVTSKGGVVAASFFDRQIARPFVVLLLANFVGLLCATARGHLFAASAAPGWKGWVLSTPHRMYDGAHPGVIGINVAWTLFNMLLLCVAMAVARETQQRRRAVRVSLEIPAGVVLPDGSIVQGMTGDLSSTGVLMRTGESLAVQPGDPVRIVLPVLDGDASLPAMVVGAEEGVLRAHFDELSLQEDEALTMVLYSRADSWLGWGESRDRDHPLRSLARLLGLAVRGLTQMVFARRPRPPRGRLATSIVPVLGLVFFLPGLWSNGQGAARAQAEGQAQAQNSLPPLRAEFMSTNAGKPNPRSPSAWLEGVSRPAGGHATAKRQDAKLAPQAAENGVGAAMGGKAQAADTRPQAAGPKAEAVSTKVQPAGAKAEAVGTKVSARPAAVDTKPATLSAKTEGGKTQPQAAKPSPAIGATGATGTAAKTKPQPQTPAPAHGVMNPPGHEPRVVAKDWGGTVTVNAPANTPSPTAAAPVAAQTTTDAAVQGGEQGGSGAQAADGTQSGWRGQLFSVKSAVSHGKWLVLWVLASVLAAQYPWALVLAAFLQCFLIAVLLRAMLRRRARDRLLGNV